MHVSTIPPAPPRKPCLRVAQLTGPTSLLPATLVPLLPLKQQRCQAHDIAVTHP